MNNISLLKWDHQKTNHICKCAVALGSNLGNSLSILEGALSELSHISGIIVKSHSSWYKTKAVGPSQPDYFNACAVLEVEIAPRLLLNKLFFIENQFGRERQERWGPRTLDLDLLLYEDLILDTPTLQIPHPRMSDRSFVLVPLAEIAPNWIEPISGCRIQYLLHNVECDDVHLVKMVKNKGECNISTRKKGRDINLLIHK